MAGLARGEIERLGDLYLRYGGVVLRVLKSVLPDASDARIQDLRQEVFLTIHCVAPRYEETGKLRSWIAGIAVRRARGWQRKRWLRERLLRHSPRAHAWTATQEVDPLEQVLIGREHISKTLAAMTHKQREVLFLRVGEGMSVEQIAEALDIGVQAAWSRLKRAQLALKTGLGSAAGESGPGGGR